MLVQPVCVDHRLLHLYLIARFSEVSLPLACLFLNLRDQECLSPESAISRPGSLNICPPVPKPHLCILPSWCQHCKDVLGSLGQPCWSLTRWTHGTQHVVVSRAEGCCSNIVWTHPCCCAVVQSLLPLMSPQSLWSCVVQQDFLG